jgi:hypothetical protein
MAANPEYAYFRMETLVTNGPISGESVVPQHKKAQHLTRLLMRPQKQVVVAQEEVVVLVEMARVVICLPVPRKR